MGSIAYLLRKIAVIPIVFYRYTVSPVLGPHCRFFPSCSIYAQQSIMQYGVGVGGWMALKRILRCHPLSAGGVDELPPRSVKR